MIQQPPYNEIFKEKKKFYYILIGFVILLVGCFGYWRLHVYPFESTDDATIDGVQISVGSEVGGRLIQLFVDEGDQVKQGDPLFVVDDTLLKIEKEKAIAGILSAENEVRLQKIKLELAMKDYARSKHEYEAKVISAEMYDHQQKAFEAEKAMLAVSEARLAVQVATLEAVQKRIEKCRVYATSDGAIGKRWHFAGDVIREGQTVFTLFDLSSIWVTAFLEETKLSFVHQNDPVKISVDAYPDLNFKGKVVFIGAGAASEFSLIPPNNASGNFTKVTQRVPIRISLQSPQPTDALYLRPGMSVEVKIKTR